MLQLIKGTLRSLGAKTVLSSDSKSLNGGTEESCWVLGGGFEERSIDLERTFNSDTSLSGRLNDHCLS
jgi:hypothetical protein